MGAAQNCRHEHVPHQGIPGRQKVGFRAVVAEVPALGEIHRMRRVPDDLPRHREEVRIVYEERLVEEWKKASGGKKQRRPRASQHSELPRLVGVSRDPS